MPGLSCSCCLKPKAEVHTHNPALDPSRTILMCKACIAAKHEPRWLIVIHGRQKGWDSVAPYIAPKQLYCGEPIPAYYLISGKK